MAKSKNRDLQIPLGFDDRVDPDTAPIFGAIDNPSLPFRTAYSRHYPSPAPVVGDSLTHQSFKDDCDVNLIYERSQRGQEVSHLNDLQPQFADLSDMPSFETALNIVRHAETTFSALPSEIRDRFSNNPANFLQFMDNPEKNLDEMVKLGLAKLRPSEGPEPLPDADSSSPVPTPSAT